MSIPCVSLRARLGVLLIAVCVLNQGQADYNEDLCNQYSSASDDDLQVTPDFFDDFKVQLETTAYMKGIAIDGVVTQQTVRYSGTHKQLEVWRTTLFDSSYYHVDEKENRCILEDMLYNTCFQDTTTCKTAQGNIGYFELISDKVTFGSSGQILLWPKQTKRKKNKGASKVRDVMSKKYVTCEYDDSEDMTTVTEWHFLDNDKHFVFGGESKAIVLLAHHHRSVDQTQTWSQRIDYFGYRKLADAEMEYGIPIDLDRCPNYHPLYSEQIPVAPEQFSVHREVDLGKDLQGSSFIRYPEIIEYHSDLKTLKTTHFRATDDKREKEMSYKYIDFSTKHAYTYSETRGNCTVSPGDKEAEKMPSPLGIWDMEQARADYIYNIRDIPCLRWTDNIRGYNYLMLATKDWLRDQGRDEDEFYPVSALIYDRRAKIFETYSFYEYTKYALYNFPYLSSCFDRESTIHASMILLIDFKTSIENNRMFGTYEFRSMVKNVTGIVSSMRVSNVFFKGTDQPGETFVDFTILGDAKDVDRSHTAYYDADPVTSQEAFNKLKAAVNKGEVTFEFGMPVIVKLKKGSLVKETPARKSSVSGGHSHGAMAAAGLTTMFVGVALGVTSIHGYIRWKKGSLPTPSFEFSKMT